VRLILILLSLILGGGSMLLFGAFLYFGPWGLVPMGWSVTASLAWNGLLSLIFFVQHSTMLRRRFRERLEQIMPSPYHGTLYAIASAVALAAVVFLWQPVPTVLLSLDGFPRLLTRTLFGLGLAGMAWGARALGRFDPLGIDAIRETGQGRTPEGPQLTVRGPYRWVRHPLYFFTIVMIWASPDLSLDRLLFNVLWTAWIWGATTLEEADLAATFGQAYRNYQRSVPRLIPRRPPFRP
jgi:protein-S-isoprenylcysteine O-methyltransferase Ste14